MIIGPYLYLWDLFPRLVLVIVASQVNHPTPVSRTEIVDLVGNNYTGLSDTTGDPPPLTLRGNAGRPNSATRQEI